LRGLQALNALAIQKTTENMIKAITSFMIASAFAVLLSGCGTSRYTVSGHERIYDESADGSKQITRALASAQKNHKRVLVQFGANWCEGCHQLHNLLKNDPAISQEVKNSFIWILIDLDQAHNAEVDEHYGNPSNQGYPALMILEADGKQVLKTDTADLVVGDNINPEKTIAFLRQWAPKR